MNDPYEILGVAKDATPEEINAAYKAAAKKAHPDSGGSSDKFTRVKQASMVLLDPRRRKQFDETSTISDNPADNAYARALELVAAFFVNTLNAMENPHVLQLEHTDMVKLGVRHFEQLIAASNTNIQMVNRQIKRFEKALKRLKSKGKKDVISGMVRHHMGRLTMVIDNNKNEIEINTKAIEILQDYEFETDSNLYGNSANAFFGQTYR